MPSCPRPAISDSFLLQSTTVCDRGAPAPPPVDSESRIAAASDLKLSRQHGHDKENGTERKRHRTTPKTSKQSLHLIHWWSHNFFHVLNHLCCRRSSPVGGGAWWCVVVGGGCVVVSFKLVAQTLHTNLAFKLCIQSLHCMFCIFELMYCLGSTLALISFFFPFRGLLKVDGKHGFFCSRCL